MSVYRTIGLLVCVGMSLYHVSLKKLMQQGICNPEFNGDLVYKFKKIIGNPNLTFETYSKSFQESRVFFRHYAADCMPSFYPNHG